MQGIGLFEWLAAADDSPAWSERSAGLVVLRLVHSVLQRSSDCSEIDAVRALVARVPFLPLNTRLAAVVSLVTPSLVDSAAERNNLARELITLGEFLHQQGFLTAAVDVFVTVNEYFRDDHELRLSALQKLAYAQRQLKKFDESEWAYDVMHSLAVTTKNLRMRLEAQLGHALVCIERGNIPEASPHVSRVLATARRKGMRDLVGRALFNRATINGIRREHVHAILDSFEALDYIERPVTRHRLMYNIATAFREVGHATAARAIVDFLATSAAEADVRMLASVLRYNLAVDAKDDLGMERSRRSLASVEKSPLPSAEYLEALARDHATHGRMDDARSAAEQMRDLAIEFGMNEVLFRAESALDAIEAGRVPVIYDFQPSETTTAAEKNLAAVEGRVGELCVV